MPTIEKLLNADWKEKLLDKSAGAGQLKGQLSDNSFIPLHFYFFIFDSFLSTCASNYSTFSFGIVIIFFSYKLKMFM